MVCRFFGPFVPNHDDDFLPTSDDRAARRGAPTDGHPSHPHRRDNSDAGSRWNGLKPSDIGSAINGPIRRQRRHDVPAQSNKGKPSIHIIPPSPPHGARPCSSRHHREIRRENQHHPSSERSQAAINARGNLPITRSTDDEGWFQLPHTVTPPREQAHHSRASDTPSINWIGTTPYRLSFDLKPSLQGGKDGTQQKRRGISDEARPNALWIFGDNGDTTNWRRRKWTQQLTVLHRLGKEQFGRALQQFALLRRCFYPRRDVIKWIRKWRMIGLSCEVHNIIQEPLTRLPLGANSTCVELPYTAILWFRVALEDRIRRLGMSLGEHVHSLYACPSVKDTHFVRFEIRNLKPGASGAWFSSLPG